MFKVGDRVRVTGGAYTGYIGTVKKVGGRLRATVTLHKLDREPPSGFESEPVVLDSNIESVDVQGARPSGDAVTAFFKGPTDYASCPKCRIGRLVPMFSGEALCDQACERKGVSSKLSGCDEYWASGSKEHQNMCLWQLKEDAIYWAQHCGSTYGLYRVKLKPGVEPPVFVTDTYVSSRHPALKGKYSKWVYRGGTQVEILEEVPV